MSVKLKLRNPDLIGEQRTYITSDYASGVSLTVRNNDGFTSNWFVIVGEPGQEQTECRQISSTTGYTTITLASALKFSHPKSCPVYLSQWDKIDVVRASSSGGVFSAISGSPFYISWDTSDLKTMVPDASGASSNYYKYRLLNSISTTYSEYSGEFPGSGLARNKAGFVIKQIQRNPIAVGVPDEAFFEYMTDYQDAVYEEMPKAWWFIREGTAKATEVDVYKYSISDNWSDFLSLKYVLYNYVSGSTNSINPLVEKTPLEFYNLKADTTQDSADTVTCFALLPPDSDSEKGYIGLHTTPETTACSITPVYEIELSAIESFDDTLVIPHIRGYKDYIFYRIYHDIKGDTTNADAYNAKVALSIQGLKKRANRSVGPAEFKRYRGVRGYSRLFGTHLSNDDLREKYW